MGPIPETARKDPDASPVGDSRLRPLLIALLVIGLVLLAWRLANVLMLGFGGVLVAILLRNLAKFVSRWTPLPVGASLVVVVLGFVLLASLFVASAGPRVAEQFGQLWQALPEALQRFRDFVGQYDWGRNLLEGGSPPEPGNLLSMATGLLGRVDGFREVESGLDSRAA